MTTRTSLRSVLCQQSHYIGVHSSPRAYIEGWAGNFSKSQSLFIGVERLDDTPQSLFSVLRLRSHIHIGGHSSPRAYIQGWARNFSKSQSLFIRVERLDDILQSSYELGLKQHHYRHSFRPPFKGAEISCVFRCFFEVSRNYIRMASYAPLPSFNQR